MDYLLTITKDDFYGKGKGKLLFILTDVEKDDSEILYKTFYPKIESKALDNLQSLYEKTDSKERAEFDYKSVLIRTIDEFVNFAKENSHRLYINFENNDIELATFFKKNYQRHVLKSKNCFNQEVIGVNYTQRVSEYFTSHRLLDSIRLGLTIKDYTIQKSKELM